MLLLTAIIWGVAFVAQSVGMSYVEPFTFNFARYMIGGIVLLPFLGLGNSGQKTKEMSEESKRKRIKKSILGGIGCGLLTVFFRYFSSYPEGVSFSILVMNALVWYIDKATKPRVFGTGKKNAEVAKK